MNTLRLNIINLHAPYRVWQKSGKPDHYYFVSDSGVEFNGRTGSWNFCALVDLTFNCSVDHGGGVFRWQIMK